MAPFCWVRGAYPRLCMVFLKHMETMHLTARDRMLVQSSTRLCLLLLVARWLRKGVSLNRHHIKKPQRYLENSLAKEISVPWHGSDGATVARAA